MVTYSFLKERIERKEQIDDIRDIFAFPKRRSQEGFVIKKKGRGRNLPDLAAIRAETSGRPPATVPIDLTPSKYVLRSSTPLDGPFWGAPPAEGLSEIHKEIWHPPRRGSRRYTKKSGTFFFRSDYSTCFFGSRNTTLLGQNT